MSKPLHTLNTAQSDSEHKPLFVFEICDKILQSKIWLKIKKYT